MGLIYLITNTKNNKKYVGKTFETLDKRWISHKSKARKGSDLALHRALRKYGEESFILRVLEDKLDEPEINTKEIYYIDKFNTYRKGYNSTLGGEGRRYLKVSKDEIFNSYIKTRNISQTAQDLGIDRGTIYTYLKGTLPIGQGNKLAAKPKAVKIVELDKEFNSAKDCASFLIKERNISYSLDSVTASVNRAARKARKTYLKLTFEYI